MKIKLLVIMLTIFVSSCSDDNFEQKRINTNYKIGDVITLEGGIEIPIRGIYNSIEEEKCTHINEINKWREKGHFAYETEEEFQRDSARRNKIIEERQNKVSKLKFGFNQGVVSITYWDIAIEEVSWSYDSFMGTDEFKTTNTGQDLNGVYVQGACHKHYNGLGSYSLYNQAITYDMNIVKDSAGNTTFIRIFERLWITAGGFTSDHGITGLNYPILEKVSLWKEIAQ